MTGVSSTYENRVELVGPFEAHEIVIGGRVVPYLQASPGPDGGVHVNLDRRLGVDLSADEAQRILPFIADCIAVAAGYTCHPHEECPEPARRSLFVRLKGLRGSEC